jgi:hypothetical protein
VKTVKSVKHKRTRPPAFGAWQHRRDEPDAARQALTEGASHPRRQECEQEHDQKRGQVPRCARREVARSPDGYQLTARTDRWVACTGLREFGNPA